MRNLPLSRTSLAALAVFAAGCGRAPEPEAIKVVEVPTPAPQTLVHEMGWGETLGGVFENHGIGPAQMLQIVAAMNPYESPRRLRPGTEIHVVRHPGKPPERIVVQLDRDRTMHLWTVASGPQSGAPQGGLWQARLDSVAIVRDTVLLTGLIGTNLVDAEIAGSVAPLSRAERNRVAHRISQVFGWHIDFTRDLRPGDAYRVLLERHVRPDGTARRVTVLAVDFLNDRRSLTAVRFHPDPLAPPEYYDVSGEAMRGQFLLAPLDIVRVTSGFNPRRFHPVLRRTRPHLGVDYGAVAGTPVRATGAGRVSRAGPWGHYGTAVEIRHANSIRTRYAHLSGLAGGIRSGTRVEQGQVIGYVGSTGLSTAPHLHYEFLQNGTHVNPARLQLPRAEPVPDEMRESFAAVRDALIERLRLIAMPVGSGQRARRTQD